MLLIRSLIVITLASQEPPRKRARVEIRFEVESERQADSLSTHDAERTNATEHLYSVMMANFSNSSLVAELTRELLFRADAATLAHLSAVATSQHHGPLSCKWCRLPLLIYDAVFNCLTYRDLRNASRACHAWRELIQGEGIGLATALTYRPAGGPVQITQRWLNDYGLRTRPALIIDKARVEIITPESLKALQTFNGLASLNLDAVSPFSPASLCRYVAFSMKASGTFIGFAER